MQLVRAGLAGAALLLSGCDEGQRGAGGAATPLLRTDAPSPESPDTALALANGTRVVAPRGWTIETRDDGVILGAPEGNSHIAIVDGGAGGPDAAVAAAWALYRPGFSGAASGVQIPAAEGWDERLLYRYESPAGEPRDVFALAQSKDERWTVLIRDLTRAVAARRDAQLEVIFNSLLPEDYARESFAGRTARRLDAARIAELTELIETARREFDIPGVALGLIQDGETVFAGGFGVRERGRPEPVDADTVFNIASNAKAMTTLMLARLVEAGRFGWDTPVASVWPEFRLGNAETTLRVQVRHLVCACTGMPRQDYEEMFEGENSSPASAMRLLSAMQPTSEFGDTYQYSNAMAAAAGYFGGHVLYPDRELGAAYDAAIRELVFDPLGMTATAPVSPALPANRAAGHGQDVDGVVRVASQDRNLAAMSQRPSGNHWSNVRDMLRYVRMELDRGLLPDGRRYIGEDVLLERRAPQATEGLNEYYGMGLKIDRQWGVDVIHHGGTMVGYLSDMIWLPDHGVGAVILINSETGGPLRAAFRRRLQEVLFDGEPIAAENLLAASARMRAAVAERRQALTVPADPEATARLARRYRSPALGALEVRVDDGATRFDFGGWDSEVATRRDADGAVVFETISPGADGFDFVVADQSGERRLVIRDSQSREYVFTADE